MVCDRAGARIGLLDYGQSKQLPDAERLAFAALVLELAGGPRGVHQERVTGAVEALGLRFARRDPKLITRMAFGMFDTRTSHRRARARTPACPLAGPPSTLGRLHGITAITWAVSGCVLRLCGSRQTQQC